MITSPGGPVGSYINALLKKRLWFKASLLAEVSHDERDLVVRDLC